MQFLLELGSCFNAMFSPAAMVAAGLSLWQRTTGGSKRCSHQTPRKWDDEKRMSHFYCCEKKSRMKETKWERRCFPNGNKATALENSKRLKLSVPAVLLTHNRTKSHIKLTRPFRFILNAHVRTHHLIRNLQIRHSSLLSVPPADAKCSRCCAPNAAATK